MAFFFLKWYTYKKREEETYMLQIKTEPLTHDAFALFGDFYDMSAPEGHCLTGELHRFYPDRIRDAYTGRIGFSALTVRKPERRVITQLEYHTRTTEILMPLDDDAILHVSPASGAAPAVRETRAFLVPKGTLVQLKPCVWHLCALPAHIDTLHVLLAIEECTYMNDCTVIDLNEADRFEIVD